MYHDEFQRIEGTWTGTERITDADTHHEASARLVFQTVFDGRFLLCDYVQTAPDRRISVGHGVFRRDERTSALTVTWFRSPDATRTQQVHGIAEGDKLSFVETIDGRSTRTTYSMVLDRLSIRTECLVRGEQWERIFEGSYRRR
jgi:hypothetical protein